MFAAACCTGLMLETPMAVKGNSAPFLLGLLLWLVVGAAGSHAGEYVERKAELDRLQQDISGLEAALERVRGERREALDSLRALELKIGAGVSYLRELDARLREQGEHLEKLGAERESKARLLQRHRETMGRQVRSAYMAGREERLKILLNQRDPAVVSRIMVYYDYLNRARARDIEAIRLDLDALRLLEKRIASEEAALQRLRSQQLAQQAELEAARHEREQWVESLHRQILDKDEQLRVLEENAKQLARLLARLQRSLEDVSAELRDVQPFSSLKGKLSWPLKGSILARFGSRGRSGGLPWDGWVIGAPLGKEVRAVHHGRVAFSDWLRGFGLMLIIDHGDGYMSLYGYNQTLFKETGEWVASGEPVALVGRSGGRMRPAVYFGIRRHGKPVDPADWCVAR